ASLAALSRRAARQGREPSSGTGSGQGLRGAALRAQARRPAPSRRGVGSPRRRRTGGTSPSFRRVRPERATSGCIENTQRRSSLGLPYLPLVPGRTSRVIIAHVRTQGQAPGCLLLTGLQAWAGRTTRGVQTRRCEWFCPPLPRFAGE